MLGFFVFCHVLPSIQFLQQFQKHLLLPSELGQTHPGPKQSTFCSKPDASVLPAPTPTPHPHPTLFLCLPAHSDVTQLSSRWPCVCSRPLSRQCLRVNLAFAQVCSEIRALVLHCLTVSPGSWRSACQCSWVDVVTLQPQERVPLSWSLVRPPAG